MFTICKKENDNLIFLDIDGVLDYQKWLSNPIRKHLRGGKFAMENVINPRNLFWVGLLCRLTHAKVIMSSSWRYAWDENTGEVLKDHSGRSVVNVDKMFRRAGINLIGTTGNRIDNLRGTYEVNEDCINHYEMLEIQEELKMNREMFLKYARGSQILDWLERNNYKGNYVILDDDISDIKVYKTLENHIVKSSFYGRHAGFGFKQFIKALSTLLATKEVEM